MNRIALALVLLASLVASHSAFAGRLDGPGISRSRVEARGSVTYTDYFVARQVAILVVIGDGDTDLDVFVYDEHGRLIASNENLSDRIVVTFTPRQTGKFYIKVVNHGNVYNNFTLETN